MIKEVEKKVKLSICQKCSGRGVIHDDERGESHVCDQCEGSGRVTVSARIRYDIRAYRPKD